MKRILAWMLIAALLLSAVGCTSCVKMAVSQMPEGDKKPVMWKATDADGHTLYLFGTIHVGDGRSDAVLEHIAPTLERCDALAVEFDVVAYQKDLGAAAESMTRFMLTDGTTIEDYLPKELYERSYALLKEAGLLPDLMKTYNLAMWAQLVESAAIVRYSDLDTEHAMDMMLINRAYEKSIPVWEVESAAYQMEVLDSFDDETYLTQIQTTLDSLELYGTSLEMMYRVWLSGDRDLFWKMIAAETDGSSPEATALEDYNARLINERNVNMAKKAEEYLLSGKTVFFAVGAAHMANEKGIVQLLIDAGYTVEEISY